MAQDPEQQQAEYDPEFLAAFEAKYGSSAPAKQEYDPEFEAAFWDKYGPTAKDYAEETLRSLDRAITSGLGQTLEAAPNLVDTAARAFLPEGRVQDVIRGATRLSPLSIAGRALNRASEDYAPQLPDYKQDLGPEGPSKTARFLTGPLSEGVGSTLTFLAGGGIARGVGAGVRGMTATMAMLGAAQNAEDARAEAQRMGATPLQELGAAGVSGALGTLEAAEPAMLLSRLERVVGKDIIRKALVELATETTTEAATEAVQQLGQDLYARGTFDPERDLGGWQEAGFQGGAVGAFMSALVSGAHIAQHKIERSREMSQAGRAIANRVVPPGTTVGAAPAPATFAPGLQNAPGPDPLAPSGAPQATASAPPLAASGAGAEPSERAQALARRTLAANRSLGFLTPEQEQGAQVGGPGDDAEQVALDAATRAMGFDPAWMDAGTRLRGMGAASDGSTIVFDRNASSGERLFALVTHEWTHAIRSLDGRPRENWNRYRDRLRATLPDLYDASEATAREARKAKGIVLDEDTAENEAVATATESLGGFLRFAYLDPNAAVRLATDNPGFFVKGLRALVRSVQRVGIPISTPHLSRLAQLDAELERHVGALGPGEKNVQGIDKQKALQVVLAAKELFDWMQANPARAMAQTGAAEVAPGAAVPPAKVVPAAPAATAPAEYVEPPAAVQPQPASSTMGYPEAQISPTEAQPQPIPEPTETPAPTPPSTPEAPPPSGEEGATPEPTPTPAPPPAPPTAPGHQVKDGPDIIRHILATTEGPLSRGDAKVAVQLMEPTADDKRTEEVLEAGFVRHARSIVWDMKARGYKPNAIFDALVKLYERQPKLQTRTSTSAREQAYSTPLPLAHLAARLAKIQAKDVVYEPTAGNGALVIDASPSNVIANELNPSRAKELFKQGFSVTQEDAARRLAARERADVVIANPPFGKLYDDKGNVIEFSNDTFEGRGFRTKAIDQQIVLNALSTMKDDGRAVLIMGGPKPQKIENGTQADHYNALEQRRFWSQLHDHYNVVDHFTVSGKLYEKQGAGWPVDVIVIEGRGKSALPLPGGAVPRVYTSWEQFKELLDADRGVAPQGQQPSARGGAAVEGQEGAADEGGVGAPARRPRASDGRGGRGRKGNGRGAPGGAGGAEQVGSPRPDEGVGTGAGGSPVGVGAGGEPDVAGETAVQEQSAPAGESERGEPRRVDLESEVRTTEPGELNVPSAEDLLKGFEELLGGPSTEQGEAPSTDEFKDLFAVEPVDEQKYAKAEPIFRKIALAVGVNITETKALQAAIIGHLQGTLRWPTERIREALPYLVRFTQEYLRDSNKVEQIKKGEGSGSYQVKYYPASRARSVTTLIPANMRDATMAALANLKERVGPLDAFVAKELGYTEEQVAGTGDQPGYFSGEQVDALALAIDNIKKGAGFVLADQTGVGKGRVVAGILTYARRNGLVPVFFTAKSALYRDMMRDVQDIGHGETRPFVTNKNLRGENTILLQDGSELRNLPPTDYALAIEEMKKTGRLPEGFDYLFTTYSQVAFKSGQHYERHEALIALMKNAIFVLDESHLAAGPAQKEDGGRKPRVKMANIGGVQVEAKIAKFVRMLVSNSQGVMYSSATWAKSPNVMDLYKRTDLGLLTGDLERAFDEGGIPFQQVVANMLVEAGQLIRREKDFTGISLPPVKVSADRATAEKFSSTVRGLFLLDLGDHANDEAGMADARFSYLQSLASIGSVGGADVSIGFIGSEGTGFASIMHNLIAQGLLGLKTKGAVELAIEAHKRGEKTVLALANTMGAALKSFAADMGIGPGDLLGEFDFRRIFLRYHERMRTVKIRDKNGDLSTYRLTDHEIMEHGGLALFSKYMQAKEDIEADPFPQIVANPIDYALHELRRAGLKAEEITGRQLVVDSKGRLQLRKASAALHNEHIAKFNGGGLDALVINQSASTGFSMHASEKFTDKKPRHMVILQALGDINEFMQILGRINRTGQVEIPLYSLAMSDLPAEVRPAANLLRKMASLNANVTSKRQGVMTIQGLDFMNKYGDRIVARILQGEREVAQLFDIDPFDSDQIDGIAAKATGRMPMLSIAEQERLLAQIDAQYRAYIEELDATGQNSLEARVLELDAKEIEKSELLPGNPGVKSPFTGPTSLSLMDVKKVPQPPSWEMVQGRVKELPSSTTDAWSNEIVDEAREITAATRAKEAELSAPENNVTDAQRRNNDKAKARQERIRMEADDASNFLGAWLSFMRPREGHGVLLRYNTETIPVVVTELARAGHTKSKLSASDYTATIYSPHFGGKVRIPASFFRSLSHEPAPWGVVSRNPNVREIQRAFDEAAAESREERYMMTGNVAAGFIAAPRGTITLFRDNQGKIQQGVVMPEGVDPRRDIERKPVPLTMEQALKFLKDAGDTHEVWGEGGIIRIIGQTGGRQELVVKAQGGRVYYTAKAVTDVVGDLVIDRRGSSTKYKARIPEGSTRRLLKVYGDLGVEWSAPLDRNRARKVSGVKEMESSRTENGAEEKPPLYAVEPDDADLKRVEKLTKKALKKGEATKIGRKPRPIANTSDNPYARASQRAAREVRFEQGMATPIPHDVQRQRAMDELESDYQGTKERLLEKIDRGDALNAWEQHAASILKNDAAMAVLTAKKGPEAKRLYRESVLLHWAYQSGARAEAARALGTIRDALTPVERLAEILSTPGEKTRKALEEGDEKMLEKALEEESPDIERMKRWLIEAGFDPENITADYLNDPISLGRIARIVSTARGTLWDWVQEWMITSMLGGPATNMANLTGNAAMQVYDQHMKRLASTLANFAVRDNTAFSVGETSAFYKAWLRGAMAGARNFVLSWRTELPVFDVELAAEGARLGKYAPKLDSQYGPKIPGVVGRLARAPSTRLLLAVDEFFKTLTATTEAAALAFRAAKNEGHKGEALDARIDELLSNKKHEIWTQAFQEAKRVTFQDENGVLTRAALQVRGWANSPWSEVGTWMANKRAFGWRVGSPPVGTALLPFIRTPVAIFRMGLSVPLHPLKALYTIPLAVAKGDRRTVLQDGTAALISLGITLAILHAVWSPGDDDDDLPFITGSGGDKRTRDLRNRTVPDYSIRVGGDWYSYRRVEPAAVTIATLVDLANEFSRYMKGGEDAQAVDALGRLIASVADQAADKTFLRTFGDLYSAIIERESKSIGPRLVRDQVLRMVPNIVRQPIGRTDEYLRQQTVRSYEDKGVWTAAAASLPYYSWPTAANAPPPRYSLWGQPVSKGDSNSIYFWRLMSPWPKSQEAERIHPLDRLILNWNAKVEDGKAGQDAKLFNPKPPDYWYTIGGKTLYWNDDEWEILQRDAGQAAAERLATRRLNYDDPNDKDIEIIQDALSRARARVRKDLLSRRNNEQEESP